jgi:DNA-binding beta-propeller fold protein YncE
MTTSFAFAGTVALLLAACAAPARGAAPPLVPEGTIPLGAVKGRIDHLAIDLAHRRLFVAELGNDSVGVVDLAAGRTIRRIAGLAEPQGVGYVPQSDMIYVAGARDGALSLFGGRDYAPAGRIALGGDADNIRVDARNHRLYAGYGDGAIAVIDAARAAKLGDIRLAAHPEGFQLEPGGTRIFVNLPDARGIAVLDRDARSVMASWPISGLRANFPMAFDAAHRRVLVAFRQPPHLAAFDADSGAMQASVETCGDADDLFVDAKRSRVYVVCGQGMVETFRADGASYASLARTPTRPGARTGLFVPALDRLFVALRARGSAPAAIQVFRPGD